MSKYPLIIFLRYEPLKLSMCNFDFIEIKILKRNLMYKKLIDFKKQINIIGNYRWSNGLGLIGDTRPGLFKRHEHNTTQHD